MVGWLDGWNTLVGKSRTVGWMVVSWKNKYSRWWIVGTLLVDRMSAVDGWMVGAKVGNSLCGL